MENVLIFAALDESLMTSKRSALDSIAFDISDPFRVSTPRTMEKWMKDLLDIMRKKPGSD